MAARADSDRLPVLWHLKVSHYNEKARWALDYKRIAHVRRAGIPGPHARMARRLSGGRTFPILELDGEVIADSTRIIEALERRQPEPPLYPADPAERRRALELEEHFDEELGPHLRLLAVFHMLPEPELLIGAFFSDFGRTRRIAARAAYPMLRRGFVSGLGIDDASVECAWEKCRAAADRIAAELQPSGHLVGDSFSVADLTVAALLAPALAPPQYPYFQPQRDHPRLADLRAVFDDGPAQWARTIYKRHRPPSAEVASAGAG